MAVPEASMQTWINEVLQISRELYNLSIRAQKLRSKTASGGFYNEAAPQGWTGAPIAEIRNAYSLNVVDLTNLFANTQVGAADRVSAHWQADRDNGI